MQIVKSGVDYNNINYIINNSGEFIMNSGTLLAKSGCSNARILRNEGSGNVEINEGNIIANNMQIAIYSDSTGTINLKGSNICSSQNYVIYNNGTGKIVLDGASISSLDNNYQSNGIYNNSGSIEIKSGDITVPGTYGINNNTGTITMSGGSLECGYYGIHNKSGNVIVTGGNLKMTKGNYADYATIYNNSGVITLGEKLGECSTENPSIISKYYGIYNRQGTFNYYDGVINAKQGYSIYGNKSDIEKDYNIVTYINGESSEFPVPVGEEKTILQQINVAKINETYYPSIIKAFEAAVDGDTIEMITDTSISLNQNTIEIGENKNITLDLAGHAIYSVKDITFINSGNFEILDSSQSKNGKILNTSGIVFENLENAVLTLTSGTVKSENSNVITNTGYFILQGANVISPNIAINNNDSGKLQISSGFIKSNNCINSNSSNTIKISGGTIEGDNAVVLNNAEILEITGGVIRYPSYSGTVINAKNTSKVYISGNETEITGYVCLYNNSYIEVNGGKINDMIQVNDNVTALINDGYFDFIRSYSTGDITINGGSFSWDLDFNSNSIVTINNGTFKGISNWANNNTIIINNGTFEYNTNVIYNRSSGTIIINDCTINTTSQYGIYNQGGGTVIFGTLDGSTSPTINSTSNSGVLNSSGIFKFYSGTITGKDESIRGKVNEIPSNTVISLSKENNIETAVLTTDIKIAKIGTTEYTNLNTAINEFDENTDEEITIINDFVITEQDKIIVNENKNIIINLNGHTIVTMSNDCGIRNSGTLKILDISNNGMILSRSNTIINNFGTLEIDGGIYSSSMNEDYLIINNEICTLTNGNISVYKCALKNDSLGSMYLNAGNITCNNYIGIYNVSGKIYLNSNITINADSYYNIQAFKNEENGEIEINGANIYSGDSIGNKGKLIINDGTIEIKTSGRYIDNNTNGILKMTGGTIKSEGSGICTSSSNNVIIEGGTIDAKEAAITNYGYYFHNTIIEISGGNIISRNSNAINNIHNESCLLTITGGKITSESGIAVQNTGILTLGENDENDPSILNPEINGKTYGVSSNKTFNFYDGIITGETLAINGEVSAKPEGYKVILNENNTVATLGIVPEVDKPVILNGNYMDSLEIAIATLNNFENKVGTIILRKDITLTNTLVIQSDVTVKLVMEGHAITFNNSDFVIENNGSLTIVDYQDIADTEDTDISKIINTEGNAIINNGNLVLGIDDGIVNENSPEINGNILGNGTILKYDGIITGNIINY